MSTESDAKTVLLATIKPHDCIYVVERRRSRSNVFTTVDLVVVEPDRSIISIGADVAALCGLEYDATMRGVVLRAPVTAAGLVFQIGRLLFGQTDLRMRVL